MFEKWTIKHVVLKIENRIVLFLSHIPFFQFYFIPVLFTFSFKAKNFSWKCKFHTETMYSAFFSSNRNIPCQNLSTNWQEKDRKTFFPPIFFHSFLCQSFVAFKPFFFPYFYMTSFLVYIVTAHSAWLDTEQEFEKLN